MTTLPASWRGSICRSRSTPKCTGRSTSTTCSTSSGCASTGTPIRDRAYGDAIAECVKAVAPLAYEAFEEHILHGRTLSRRELELIKRALDLDTLADVLDEAGLRKSRRRELLAKLDLTLPTKEKAEPAD